MEDFLTQRYIDLLTKMPENQISALSIAWRIGLERFAVAYDLRELADAGIIKYGIWFDGTINNNYFRKYESNKPASISEKPASPAKG